MHYTGSYIYPPRTNSKIPYTDNPALDMWKSYTDSVGQWKLDGNRNLIKVFPDRRIEFWNRHKKLQKYSIPQWMKDSILDISPSDTYTLWDSELLEFKTKGIKDVIYIFDCLVWKSEYLIGYNYRERYSICEGVLGDNKLTTVGFIKPGIYLANNIPVSDWDNEWLKLQDHDYLEGLVLKRLDATSKLTYGLTPVNNNGFMARVRKKDKNLLF